MNPRNMRVRTHGIPIETQKGKRGTRVQAKKGNLIQVTNTAAAAAVPAAGPGSSRIVAPADISATSVVLAAGGGTVVRLHS